MPRWEFDAIGTAWRIDSDEDLPHTLRAEISSRIEEFDRCYSRFRDDSLVAALSHSPGTYQFPADAEALFAIYEKLYLATSGRINPLIGPVLDHWGYDRHYRLTARSGPAPKTPAFSEVWSMSGTTLNAPRPLGIDVGAVGKGFLVEEVAAILRGASVDTFTVDASGDIRHQGGAPERIGLENPANPERVLGVVELSNQALAASSHNRRRWSDHHHHIMDALTGLPTSATVATFVVCDHAGWADGLATALMMCSPESLSNTVEFEWLTVSAHFEVRHSDGFPAEVYV